MTYIYICDIIKENDNDMEDFLWAKLNRPIFELMQILQRLFEIFAIHKVLVKLMALKTLELDQAKNQLPERSVEVKQFEQSVKTLQTLFLSSLELNANAEARAKEQFLSDLVRKDKTIDELREKITLLEKQKNELEAAAKEALADKALAEEQKNATLEKLEAAQKNASNAEQMSMIISKDLATAEQKLDGYAELKATHDESVANILKLNQTIESLTQQHRSELELIKKDGELNIAHAIAEKEQEMQSLLQNERSRADKAIGQLELYAEQIKELKAQVKELTK